MPDAQEQGEANHGDDGGDDVDQPGPVEVGDEILRDGEGDARHQEGGEHLEHAAEADEGPDQPDRHNDGEEGQLTADHAAELQEIEPGDGG
jgi:hypothetical protein